MGWAEHVARRVTGETHTEIWWGYLREGYHLEDPGIGWRIIFKLIFKWWD